MATVFIRPAASLACGLICAVAWPGSSFGWVSLDAGGYAVAVDAAGDIYAGGTTELQKLDGRTGRRIWRTAAAVGTAGLALDGTGGVITVGTEPSDQPTANDDLTIVKRSQATGADIWRRQIDGAASAFDAGTAVALDAAGDVFAVGLVGNAPSTNGADLIVAKLSGVDGTEVWRREVNGTAADSLDKASAVAVDGAGDVVVGGQTENTGTGNDFTVLKLSGSTGADVWPPVVIDASGGEVAFRVAIDPAGDVLAAGPLGSSGVVKFFGTTGVETWRGGWGNIPHDVVADSAGDVLVVGSDQLVPEVGWRIAKLAGSSGLPIWTRYVEGAGPSGYDEGRAVTLDADGDVLAAGSTRQAPFLPNGAFTVVKLSATTGATIWFQALAGRDAVEDVAHAVTVDPAGNVIATGLTLDVVADSGTVVHPTVAKFSDRIVGSSLRVVDSSSVAPASVSVASLDANLIVPVGGAASDPTIGGGILEVINPTTGESDTYPLAADGWTARLTGRPGFTSFTYRERSGGPCTRVKLASTSRGGSLRARCRGDLIGFSLDEPSQGGLGIRLTIGDEPFRYCMFFGGTVIRDTPGEFRAMDAPAPVVCPAP